MCVKCIVAGSKMKVPTRVSTIPIIAAQPHVGTRAKVANASPGAYKTLRYVTTPFGRSVGAVDVGSGVRLMSTPLHLPMSNPAECIGRGNLAFDPRAQLPAQGHRDCWK